MQNPPPGYGQGGPPMQGYPPPNMGPGQYGNMIACGGCGNAVSAAAQFCPQCGQRLAGAAPRKTPAPRVGAILGGVLAVLLAIGAIAYCSIPDARNSVARIASGAGVPVVPWTDRARAAADAMFRRNGAGLAQSILAVTHPTGTGARLLSHAVTVEGDEVVSRLTVEWKGGVLGTDYSTTVEWRCAQAGDMGTKVMSDTALIPIVPQSAAQLDSYFRSSVYPALMQSAN